MGNVICHESEFKMCDSQIVPSILDLGKAMPSFKYMATIHINSVVLIRR